MFHVDWTDAAMDALADILVMVDLETQHRIAKAIDRLNAQLRNRPFDEGESRSDNRRITFIDLLSVRFRVFEDSRTVRVTGVLLYGQ